MHESERLLELFRRLKKTIGIFFGCVSDFKVNVGDGFDGFLIGEAGLLRLSVEVCVVDEAQVLFSKPNRSRIGRVISTITFRRDFEFKGVNRRGRGEERRIGGRKARARASSTSRGESGA